MKVWLQGVVALAGIVFVGIIAAVGFTQDHLSRQESARATVVQYTTELSKRNFYDACQYYSKDQLDQGAIVTGATGIPYSNRRACAISLVVSEATSVLFGSTVFDSFIVDKKPLTAELAKKFDTRVPKNGYVFQVRYIQGVVYVQVQRDDHGDWKVVGVVVS